MISLLAASLLAVQTQRPNIIVILADDLGYSDVGFNGSRDIPTPNIDSIAHAGVRFSSAYVTAPVCSPTRAGILTGIQGTRFGYENNPPLGDDRCGLPTHIPTLPERLNALGYRTACVGKWHLGTRTDSRPLTRGFQEFFGFLEGGSSYYFYYPGWRVMYEGHEPVQVTDYLTHAFTNRAARFIDEHAGSPFFLYLSYNAPHGPLQAPADYLARFRKLGQTRGALAAMVSVMDDGVGKVLARLKENGIYDNTLIFFLSDNGGVIEDGRSSNHPLQGGKNQIQEGGLRVPFAVSWPRQIPQGVIDDRMVSSLDILPTAVGAAGKTLGWTGVGAGFDDPARYVDGRNILSFIRKEDPRTTPIHPSLCWRYGAKEAIRSKSNKFRRNSTYAGTYDLAADIGETTNLINKKPALTAQLKEGWQKWNANNVPPLW